MAILASDPNVAAVHRQRRRQRRLAAGCNVDLKPRDERDAQRRPGDRGAAAEVRARARASASCLPNPPAIRIGGMMSRAQYQFTLQDPDTEELYRVAPGFEAALRNVPGCSTSTRTCRSGTRS